MSRVVIVGAGHNGLTTAFYLARAGLNPLVLERRSIVGGAAATEEIAPGFRCPSLAHTIGPLRPSIVRDMRLEQRGVEFVRPDPRLVALSTDRTPLVFSSDERRTAAAIRAFSSRDADRYGEFCGVLSRMAHFLGPLLTTIPLSIDSPDRGDIWELLKIGRRFRALGKKDGFRLLRWGPMAAADLVREWFDTDLLQATIAARGIFGASQGPRSAGSAALLLLNAAIDPVPGGSSVMVKGGPGALTAAMADAAREAGAEIRLNAGVKRIVSNNGRVSGVLLEDAREIAARAVVSNADPKRTLLDLVDPIDLDPEFLTRIRNYRCRGSVAKINLALSSLPAFTGIASHGDLRGRLHIGPSLDYLERAYDASKYGEISAQPFLDVAIPTLIDPSLAPSGKHVLSISMQFAPYSLRRGRDWESARAELLSTVIETLDRHAPGINGLVEQAQVLTPLDLEGTYGLTGGHIYHGEPALDQLFTMRPVLGCARYRTPIAGLFLCGSGTHPGGGITGGPGQNAAREILKALK
ncbi:MAG: phytoene desaturase family protein [Vicinamibacterales bacterium]